MPLSAGDKLGPYEIIAPIGAGGMGEVYKGHDPRLRRDVAIKVSAQQFSERFEREAHAIAALNHPNICQVYDVRTTWSWSLLRGLRSLVLCRSMLRCAMPRRSPTRSPPRTPRASRIVI